MILFVNACPRENSRTLELAKEVLANLHGEVREIPLYPNGAEGLTPQTLQLREELSAARDFSHPMFDRAKEFAAADVVLAAPYWDLLFPAKVRAYLEEVTVTGVSFRYSEEGIPVGLCKAKQLIYVTSAGGPIVWNMGYEYVEKLARALYGISDVRLVKAEGLDIRGADTAAIMEKAKEEIPAILA